MVSHRYEGLEVEEDMRFERRDWRFQRIGRIGLVIFLVLAFIGLTGSGPLSDVTARSADGSFDVTYERIDRISSPGTLQIRYQPEAVTDGELRVWINANFNNWMDLEMITPQPARVEVNRDRYVYAFPVTTSDQPARISFHVKADKPGIARMRLGIVDGPEVSFRQIIFP